MPRNANLKNQSRRNLAGLASGLAAGLKTGVAQIVRAAAAPERSDSIIRASVTVEPSTLDREKRTVSAVIATENPQVDMDRRNWTLFVGVLLAEGMERVSRIGLLDTHQTMTQKFVLGSAYDLARAAGKNTATLQFSTVPDADEAFTKVAEGHLRNLSIRAAILKVVEISPGQSKSINGKNYTAPADMPMRVVTRWRPVEVSVCAIGVDEGAVTRNQPNGKESGMNFEQFCIERGFDPTALSEVQRASLTSLYNDFLARAATDLANQADDKGGDKTNPPAKVPSAGQVTRAQTDGQGGDSAVSPVIERAIAQGIAQGIAQRDQVEAARRTGIRNLGGPDVPADLIARCVDDPSVSVDVARSQILDHVRKNRPSVPAAHVLPGGGEITRAHVAAGLCLREGMASDRLVRAFGEQTVTQADRFSRHLTMMDIARTALTLDRREIPHDREEMLRAAFTTSNLSAIFSDAAHLFVMQGFEQPSTTWREFCQIMSASDFKSHTGVQLGSDSRLKLVQGSTGEVKHGRFVEESQHYAVGTYAELLGITRKHFIDDALGLLQQASLLMGQEAMELIGDLAYTALLANPAMDDGKAMFVLAGHKNLNAGLTLTDANLSTAKLKFRQQTGLNGRRGGRSARIMLIPDELERIALQLLTSENINPVGVTDGSLPNTNVHYNTLKPVVESRLSDATFHASASAATWYLSGGPEQGSIGVAFLNGKQTPTIVRFDPGPNYVAGGIILQVFIDAGAAPMNYRNMQKNN